MLYQLNLCLTEHTAATRNRACFAPITQANTNFLSLWSFLFCTSHTNRILYLTCSIMASGFICRVAYTSTFLLRNNPKWIDHILSLYQLMHIGVFLLLALVRVAAIHICLQIFVWALPHSSGAHTSDKQFSNKGIKILQSRLSSLMCSPSG